jgi:hypothetical protein
MSLTKLGGNYDVIYKLFLPRESLVSEIPAGDRNMEKLVYGVRLDYCLGVIDEGKSQRGLNTKRPTLVFS